MKQIEERHTHDANAALDQAGAALQRQLLRLRGERRRRDCAEIHAQPVDEERLGQALLEAGLRIRYKA
jgi:hypothetical protein